MMKNGNQYAIAVRKPNKEIVVETKSLSDKKKSNPILKLPIIRGVMAFVESLSLGMQSLTFSSSFYEEEEEESKFEKKLNEITKGKGESIINTAVACASVLLAIGIFVVLPMLLANFLSSRIENSFVLAFLEGVFRLLIFLVYIGLISQMEDIRRLFMYHGAEHKSINCIENGLPLTVENVRDQSKEHKRCGTSFMLFVIVISIILFIFIKLDNPAMQLLIRVLLVPVIAGISYEILKLAGSKENALTNALSKPGMWLQGLTTKEPTDDMIEVAIAAVEAVFDWKAFQNEKDEETGEDDELDGFEMIDVADTDIEEEQSEDLVFEETVEDSEDIVEDKPKRIEDIRTIDDIEEIFEDVAV